MHIQWYPGHMAQAKRLLTENLKLIDIVIELLDARIPISSRNPEFERMMSLKQRVLVMNKKDLADEYKSEKWEKHFTKLGICNVWIDSKKGEGFQKLKRVLSKVASGKIEARKARGREACPIRLMVIGIPNVGKSSFINKIVGKSCTAVENRPGVTRGKQWVRISKEFQLLDTPGILWPKFETQDVAFKLACVGTLKRQLFDQVEVACWLVDKLRTDYSEAFCRKYRLADIRDKSGHDLLRDIAIRRNYVKSGAEPDLLRAAAAVLDDFQAAKIGKITLEEPEDK